MRYQTVRDIIDHSKRLHHDLGEFYRSLEDKVQSDRVKMLLNYLARHEEHIEESLKKYTLDANQNLWDEWFQFGPDEKLTDLVSELKFAATHNLDEVVKMALAVDDYFIDLYKKLSINASSEKVRELFVNLVEMEELEKTRTVRSALELSDM